MELNSTTDLLNHVRLSAEGVLQLWQVAAAASTDRKEDTVGTMAADILNSDVGGEI